jgi:hypothetical protein
MTTALGIIALMMWPVLIVQGVMALRHWRKQQQLTAFR